MGMWVNVPYYEVDPFVKGVPCWWKSAGDRFPQVNVAGGIIITVPPQSCVLATPVNRPCLKSIKGVN